MNALIKHTKTVSFRQMVKLIHEFAEGIDEKRINDPEIDCDEIEYTCEQNNSSVTHCFCSKSFSLAFTFAGNEEGG